MPLPIFIVIRTAVALSALWTFALIPDDGRTAITERPQPVIGATQHDPVPTEDADAWFVPDRAPDERERALAAMAEALGEGDYARVQSLGSRLIAQRDLGGYARLYLARAHFAQGNLDQARQLADALAPEAGSPYLAEQARLLAAETAMKALDHRAALEHLDALMSAKPIAPERALLLVGRAHALANDPVASAAAFTRVYYEFALTNEAAQAAMELAALGIDTSNAETRASRELQLGRAERLFGARRYADAKRAFEALREDTNGGDRTLVEVRLGQIEYYAGRYSQARALLAAHADGGSREAEARYFSLLALRESGQGDAFVRGVRALVDDRAESTWAADALDALGTHHVRADDDATAAKVFTEIFDRYPSSERTPRAAWMAGWRAYRTGNFNEAVRIFDRAAADFPRSDLRPGWLYWSARAHGESGDPAGAASRHKLVLADYAHSYYGRLSARRLGIRPPVFQVSRAADRRPARSTEETAREAFPNGAVIHRLLRAGLYDEALGELRAAELAWGSTPALQATIAWATREKGDLLRASVLMKRAYPQYLSRAGASLPDDVLRVTYPVNYWSLIRKYSAAHKLDPYLIAALIAQESGYEPSARSAANAWGLMQILPSTGRSYARKLGIRRFSTQSLTDPETNIRIGTAYFADQIARLGSAHAALAGYNAGPSRARRWTAEKPRLERDEWIDDIPFPETQFYVKRILGTAEDYRALYGSGFDPTLKRTAPKPRGASGGE